MAPCAGGGRPLPTSARAPLALARHRSPQWPRMGGRLWTAQRCGMAAPARAVSPLGPQAMCPRWVGRLRAAPGRSEASGWPRASPDKGAEAQQLAHAAHASDVSHEVLLDNNREARSGARPLQQALCLWCRHLTRDQHLCYTFRAALGPMPRGDDFPGGPLHQLHWRWAARCARPAAHAVISNHTGYPAREAGSGRWLRLSPNSHTRRLQNTGEISILRRCTATPASREPRSLVSEVPR